VGKVTLNLKRYNRICLDTAPFIYFIEENPRYISIVERIFSEISYGNILGISSYLTLLEVLVRPIKENAREIANEYRDLLLGNIFLRMFPLDDRVAEKAAELRAKYDGNGFKLNTPDAIQIATGLLNGAEIFLTNDRDLKQVQEMEVVILDEVIT
jgi:predicted nucleic acid-binding protein